MLDRLVDRLGIPGLFDVHTHFLPPRVMAKVREQFDSAGPLIGRPWPLHYRDTDEALVATLRGLGVRHFTALAYAHRPDMAEFLNDWTLDFAARTPGCLPSATFYPEPGVATYVARRIEEGARVFKVHVQVGALRRDRPAARRGVGRDRGRRHPGGAARRAPARSAPSSPAPTRSRRCCAGTRGCRW